MMKKLIAIVLLVAMALTLVACGGTEDPVETTGDHIFTPGDDPSSGGEEKPEDKPFSIDLDGFVANIGNATALGISKSKPKNVAPVFAKNGTINVMAIADSNQEFEETKSYIVMTTTEYGANTPEADKNGLTKVTFTKIVTENITTETTGTKYYLAADGKITIPAVTGFSYTVRLNGEIVTVVEKEDEDNSGTTEETSSEIRYENLADNSSYDRDETPGVLVLDGLTDSMEYQVDYHGIGEEIVVTQDELNGEIDKLYSAGGYTFISFVPEGMTGESTLKYDYYGVDQYHKWNYESNAMRQSFVIDNKTGYIYQIEGFSIEHVCIDGLVRMNNRYYNMTVNDQDELVFKQIVQNETVRVYRAFKDKYGRIFVYNDTFDAFDADNNVFYYTNNLYFLTEEGEVVYIEPSETYGLNFSYDGDVPKEYSAIYRVNSEMEKEEISNDETYHLIIPVGQTSGEDGEDQFMTIGTIEDGYMIISGPSLSTRVELSTLKSEHTGDFRWVVTVNKALIYKNNNLYYTDIWGANSFQLGDQNLVLLVESCKVTPEWGGKWNTIELSRATFTETVYYKIILDENGVPKAVNSKTYVAPEKDVVTLQPINK